SPARSRGTLRRRTISSSRFLVLQRNGRRPSPFRETSWNTCLETAEDGAAFSEQASPRGNEDEQKGERLQGGAENSRPHQRTRPVEGPIARRTQGLRRCPGRSESVSGYVGRSAA